MRHYAMPFYGESQCAFCKTVDSKVLNLAKQDIIWHSVNELLTEDEKNPILGLNIVEFAGNNKEKNRPPSHRTLSLT